MSEQVQKQKPAPQERASEKPVEAKARTEEQQALLDSDIMDEIDAALEGLDQDLAQQYVQKGGE